MTANDSSHAVWQISGGPASRAYTEVFLRPGVALIGPGDAGPWKPERDDDEFEDGFVRRASEVAAGDVLLLRTGLTTITAVGLVAGDYLFVNAFDDVNGWDLQHSRRVRWYRLPEEHAFGSAVFGANPARCSRVWNEEVVDFAEPFLKSPPTHWQTAPCMFYFVEIDENVLRSVGWWGKEVRRRRIIHQSTDLWLRCGSSSSPWDIKPVGEQRASRRFLTDNPNGCWGL